MRLTTGKFQDYVALGCVIPIRVMHIYVCLPVSLVLAKVGQNGAHYIISQTVFPCIEECINSRGSRDSAVDTRSFQVRKVRSSSPTGAVTIVPLGKAFKFHIASSLSLVAMDSIRNEVSRVIYIS